MSEGEVKGRVELSEGRPIDRNAVEQSRAAIDSLYKHDGYYSAEIKTLELAQDNGRVRVVYDVEEGERVAISQVVVNGNRHFSDKQVVKHMATRPEGFWWFQKGEYDERKVDQDVRERLPHWYADNGFVDFQVTHDSLVADSAGGKAVLHLTVDEGKPYQVGRVRYRGQPALLDRGAAGLYPSARSGRPARRRRVAAVQPVGVGRGDGEGPDPLRQQRLHLRPGRAERDPAHRRRRQAGGRSALDHPRGLAGHDQQGRDRRQRRRPTSGSSARRS